MSRTIFVGGEPVRVRENADAREVCQAAKIDGNHFLAIQNPGKEGYEIFDEKKTLPKEKDINLVSLPRYRQGSNFRENRIIEEVKLISHRFPVEVDSENLNYIAVRNFPLNRNYSHPTTTVLIEIPERYPEVPPVHFFMNKSITYKGKCPSHFFKGESFNELQELKWGKYCLHLDNNWRPSQEILNGDSLLTYLELIKTVLDNLEREMV